MSMFLIAAEQCLHRVKDFSVSRAASKESGGAQQAGRE